MSERLPFTFRLTPLVLRLLALEPESARALIERCGLPPEALDGKCTTDLQNVRDLLDEAQDVSGPKFGIDLALAVPEGTYEVAEILVRTASTFGEGLAGLARFSALINPVGRFDWVEEGARGELHYSVPGRRDGLGETLNVFTMAYVVRAMRAVGLPDDALTSVWFAHATVGPREHLRSYFGCAVTLGAPTTGLAFRDGISALPLRTSDGVTHDFLRRHAEQKLEALGPSTIAALVADELRKEGSLQGIDLARVAKRLGMSERTAQRRLAEEGTSFREVLDHVRERIASDQIAAGTSAARVAAMLGFADTRGYRRAIARWEGGAVTALRRA